jgi:apolipoprotein N-acyltransferase
MNAVRHNTLFDTIISIPAQQLAWLWLLIGFLLLPFTAWQTVIPLAAWLAPVFLLRFERTCSRPRLVAPLIFAAYTGAFLIDLRNYQGDVTGWIIVILFIPVARGLLYLLPYIADLRIGSRLGAWGRWLVFPLAFTSVDWLLSQLKLTTAGSPAYSQYSILPLIQILSVTGMWGLTFLIGWFATTVNACWEGSFSWKLIRGKLLIFTGVLLAVLIYGGLRLSLTQGQGVDSSVQNVKVATITNETIFEPLNSMNLGTFYQSSDAERDAMRPKFAAANDVLFARIETALQAGAKIVATQETAGLALAEDADGVIARASSLARQYHAYLELSLWVFDRTQALPYVHNQSILIDPQGQVQMTYDKTHPVFPGESFLVISGSGRLPIVTTPYGRLSTAICNDLHYPALLRQAGRQDVDILLAPFDDDPAIDTQDPAEAAFRTIEGGYSSIRAAGNGLSMITDPEGRVLASQDYFTTNSHMMIADLPVHAEKTVYSLIGDTFAYLSIAGLIFFAVLAFLHSKGAAVFQTTPPYSAGRDVANAKTIRE